MIILRVYLVALVFSPPVYVIAPLGAAGTPAGVLGMIMLVLWAVRWAARPSARLRPSLLHWILLALVVCTLLSFFGAMLRNASESEVLGAERGLLALASWSGVILVAADCVLDKRRFEALIRFLVAMGACLGAMAVIQFFTRIDYVALLHLPGLALNSDVGNLYVRAGFARVSATAIHSIELAMVLGLIVPFAFYRTRKHRRFGAWVELFLIMAPFPLTVSRSGIIALVLGIVAGALILGLRQRVIMLCISLSLAAVVVLASPGLVDAVSNLFSQAGEDTSVMARQSDYSVVLDYVAMRPWIGRGLFTFIPSMYRTLDNQYLGTLVELGIFGLLSMVALIVAPMMRCLVGRSDSDWPLRIASSASLAIGAVLFGTFDAMSFPMAIGMFSLVIGMSRGTWSRGERARGKIPPVGPATVNARSLIGAASGSAIVMLVGLGFVVGAHDSFHALGSFVVRVPNNSAPNVYNARRDTYGVSDVLWAAMDGKDEHDALCLRGVCNFAIAIGTGSLEAGTDRTGYGDTMTYRVVASDPDQAVLGAREVLSSSAAKLISLQTSDQAGVPSPLVVVADASKPVVSRVPVHRVLACAALLALSLLAFRVLQLVMTRIMDSPRRNGRAAADPSLSRGRHLAP